METVATQRRNQPPSFSLPPHTHPPRKHGRPLAVAAFAVLLSISACSKSPQENTLPDNPPAGPNTIQSPAQQDDLQPITAEQIHALIDQANCPVVVSIWASWCRSARDGTPSILPLQRALKAGRIQWIFVCIDTETDTREHALPWLRNTGLEIPVYFKDENEPDTAFLQRLNPGWSGTLPATILYDQEGKQVALFETPVEAGDLLDQLGINVNP